MEAHKVTVLLLGDAKVGKTTLLSRISKGRQQLSGRVPITLLRDIDQPFIFEIRSRKAEYRLEVYDTSSPDNWRTLQPDLIVICYDISQRLSLLNLQRTWIKEVRTTFLSESVVPILVLGLKRDLRSEDDPNGVIYPQEAHQVAQEMRADKYMECSAVTGELLNMVFEDICVTAMQTTTLEGGQSGGNCSLM
ncbi:GTP-binding protein RHO4 [Phialemonium atrogriseum]|uniref:GTP-binding protein RHO4 n=1 Tax=Phialemonium atrogriseum TaxID=1093897 RepID=A0AAJ0CDL9_9PEZI|nr:GTP-binding protein RHO4 [Phialemonium atrogriseum]KAK1772386.1 GTP-binding protein RHO4 [Phialemonium atrogriseum]